MKNYTDEFSFVLKCSEHGIGVFAVHAIAKDTLLRTMGHGHDDYVERNKDDVPEVFHSYCLQYEDGKMICPKDFSRMSVEWFLNHAADERCNTYSPDGVHTYSSRDIEVGEEIFIDYNNYQEPKENKESYY